MDGPRVLVVLNTSAAWSRGILRGFMETAHQRGWLLLHYHPSADLGWLQEEWTPSVLVLGPEVEQSVIATLGETSVISVNQDRSAQGVASVCPDEEKIAKLALEHLASKGYARVTTFRFNDAAFAAARENAFCAAAQMKGLDVVPGWWLDDAQHSRAKEDPHALVKWLRGLPKPCGVFTCADAWGRVVARYARAAGLRVPEDLALIGVDNDAIECELIVPSLSSIAIPWREMGVKAADLAQLALKKKNIAGKRWLIPPVAVVGRRSSDALGIDDTLVSQAVRWIQSHAEKRLSVPSVASAVSSSRQRLERKFRAALGRTVQEEIRRARVEKARALLEATDAPLAEVAKRSGFTTAALLSVAFQRELGMPPGAYRRRSRAAATGNHQ